jgi:hypothetical protein
VAKGEDFTKNESGITPQETPEKSLKIDSITRLKSLRKPESRSATYAGRIISFQSGPGEPDEEAKS